MIPRLLEKLDSFLNDRSRVILTLLVLALVIRLFYVLALPQQPLGADAEDYDLCGWHMALGNGLTNDGVHPRIVRGPAYPFFLAVQYDLFGHDYTVVRVTQSLLSALTVLMIFFLGRRLANERMGFLAAAIYCFAPATIIYSGMIMTETFFNFLVVASVVFLEKMLRFEDWKAGAVTGLLLALAVLTRSLFLFAAIFMVPVIFYGCSSFKKSMKLSAVLLLFFLIGMAPWFARQYYFFGTIFPETAQVGMAIDLANRYDFDYLAENSGQIATQREDYPLEDLSDAGADLNNWNDVRSAGQESGRIALRYALSDPARLLKDLGSRFFILWFVPIGRNVLTGWGALGKALALGLSLYHWALLLVFLIGTLLWLRRNLATALVPLSVVVYLSSLHSVVYSDVRYHFPLIPFIALGAGYALMTLWKRWTPNLSHEED